MPVDSLAAMLADTLTDGGWRAIARPEQIMPDGDHSGVLVMAGRGWGKTRTGCEWVREQALRGSARIALVAPTTADVRDVIVEGESGILAISPDWDRPIYESSKRRLTWKNGSIATCFSAEEADRLRGPQHTAAYCDEAAAWPDAQAVFNMLVFGLRLGQRPQWVITTTPKPTPLLKALLKREGKGVIVRRGTTFDNSANLAPSFITSVESLYGGSRIGRQELLGEMVDDVPGALFSRELLDETRVQPFPKIHFLKRVVVAVDPAVSTNKNSDLTGISVCGVDYDDHYFVLDDLSGKYSPSTWASVAIGAYNSYSASKIVAEANQGGDLLDSVLRSIDRNIPIKLVRASRGKLARAEPIVALFEQKRAHLAGDWPALEDELCSFAPGCTSSPDRLDAMVWALTELSSSQNRAELFFG